MVPDGFGEGAALGLALGAFGVEHRAQFVVRAAYEMVPVGTSRVRVGYGLDGVLRTLQVEEVGGHCVVDLVITVHVAGDAAQVVDALLIEADVALLPGRADHVDGVAHDGHHDHHGRHCQGAQDGSGPRRRGGHLVLGLAHVPQIVAEDGYYDEHHRSDLQEEAHRGVAGEQAGQQGDDVAQDDARADHQGQVGQPASHQGLATLGVGGDGSGEPAHQDQVQGESDDDRRDGGGIRG